MLTPTQAQRERGLIPQSQQERKGPEALSDSEGWRTEEGAQLIKFDEPGQTLMCTLLDMKMESVNDDQNPGTKRDVMAYYVASMDGEALKFFGSYDLAQKIKRVHIGMQLRIRYMGKQDIGDSKNMNVFHVQSREAPRQARG